MKILFGFSLKFEKQKGRTFYSQIKKYKKDLIMIWVKLVFGEYDQKMENRRVLEKE